MMMQLSAISLFVFCNIFISISWVEGLCPRVTRWQKVKFSKKEDYMASQTHKWFSSYFAKKKSECKKDVLRVRAGDSRVLRKEYRTLKGDERRQLHRCLLEMTAKPAAPDGGTYYGQSEFTSFVTEHRFQYSPEAHGSPAFSPYHKIFIYFFENMIRTHKGCENMGLPYWDSTLDSALPNPSDSAIFTEEYLGDSKGEVKAEFINSTTQITTQYCKQNFGEKLRREVCKDGEQLMTDKGIHAFVNCGQDYSNCTMPKNSQFEEEHGLVHGCLGGHMSDLTCAPFDLIFYLHHCFVDMLFEQYLGIAFPDIDPINAYIKDELAASYYTQGDEPMRPFDESGYRVRDGMSRNFTRDFYRYAPRPVKCRRDSQCRSEILWCDLDEGRCKAKVKLGGDCTNLDATKCCFGSNKCNKGIAICSEITSRCQCSE